MSYKQNGELKTIFDEALVKFEQGALKYGDFDPASDERDLLKETEAEILDALNYLGMFLIKIRAIGKRKEENSRHNFRHSL